MKKTAAAKTAFTEIKTFEDACAKLGLDPATVIPDMAVFPGKHRKALESHAKMVLVAQALNNGWEPNWDDDDEYKYWPWFWMDSPGFRFGGSYCTGTGSDTTGGSRLCFPSREISDYAGKTFLELYREMMVIG